MMANDPPHQHVNPYATSSVPANGGTRSRRLRWFVIEIALIGLSWVALSRALDTVSSSWMTYLVLLGYVVLLLPIFIFLRWLQR